jgi:hypothetical protein
MSIVDLRHNVKIANRWPRSRRELIEQLYELAKKRHGEDSDIAKKFKWELGHIERYRGPISGEHVCEPREMRK